MSNIQADGKPSACFQRSIMFPLTQLYRIRPATTADAKDILAIYAYYVVIRAFCPIFAP